MENKIERIAEACAQDLLIGTDISLYSGNSGTILFLIMHSLWKNERLNDKLEKQVQRLLDMSITSQSSTLAGGRAGIYWLFKYLTHEKELLDEALCEEICDDLPYLQEQSLAELKKGHWDLLHSSMGTAYLSLYHYRQTYQTYFEMFFSKLRDIAVGNSTTGLFAHYDYQSDRFNEFEVNLGLAHGIPSILKFCIECYKKNVCSQDAYTLGKKVVDFLMNHANDNKSYCYYPSVLNVNGNNNQMSRLAWCYGDLGIGIILFQAGIAFNDVKVVDFALGILRHTTRRKTEAQSMVYDAGICHGSAGVAHIYNKMWHYTKDSIFKDATDFWINRTLDFAIHEDGLAGYKRYVPSDKTYENSNSLIEGAAGIGLVLLSYLTGDFSWDYCLMLND